MWEGASNKSDLLSSFFLNLTVKKLW